MPSLSTLMSDLFSGLQSLPMIALISNMKQERGRRWSSVYRSMGDGARKYALVRRYRPLRLRVTMMDDVNAIAHDFAVVGQDLTHAISERGRDVASRADG